ncbi:MAG: dTMP kinase [Gammaproteobacteria bacterium]|tara:strand:- start:728 stop:1342 length:615 start_codon:yes stop_codon:yes gene_type:complete
MFISFEGIEGSGKSSLIKNLKNYYKNHALDVFFTKEPGGTELGEKIREILLDPTSEIDPSSELLLLMADRVHHVKNKINPNLNENKIVFCDRYIDSTIAYQGGGRDLDDKDIEGMIKMLKLPIPDLTILLDVPVETGLKRAKERSELDRFEKEDIDFHKKIRQSYLNLQKKYPDRIIIFNASINENDVFEEVLNYIKSKIDDRD